MIQEITTSFNDFRFAKPIGRRFRGIRLFSHANTTSMAPYHLPSYLSFLVVKHYQAPVFADFEAKAVILTDVDFLVVSDQVSETEDLIAGQKEHDAHFCEPMMIRATTRRKVVFR